MAKVDNSEHVARLRNWLKRQRTLERPVGLRRARRSKDGVWTFWKVTTSDWTGPWYGGLAYRPGRRVRVSRAGCNSDPSRTCTRGLHLWPFLPTPDFVLDWATNGRTVEVEVEEKDIVAVPFISDEPKLRVCNMKVIKEVFPQKISRRAKQRRKQAKAN